MPEQNLHYHALGVGQYSLKEEVVSSVVHGIAVLLSVAALVLLVVFASLYGDTWHIVSCSIFGASLVLLYTASTLYHAITNLRAKRLFKMFDHMAIFVLIAGTYTPFLLVNLRGPWGWSLFGVIWGLTFFGIIFKALSIGRFRLLSVLIYQAMGFLALIAIFPLCENVARAGLVWLGVGGFMYCAGTIFYLCRWIPFHHAIWHMFVLSGSVCHFFAVFFYVIPPMSSLS